MIIKFLLVGDTKVGKSCILDRFIGDNFFENYSTTNGIDFGCKKITYDNTINYIQLWDTSGHNRFKPLIRLYYKTSNCIIIVYDITNKSSFENVKEWIKDIDKSNSNIRKIIVGNKKDLSDDRIISYLEGKELANLYNLDFYEISAKDDINITDIIYNNIKEKETIEIQKDTGNILEKCFCSLL